MYSVWRRWHWLIDAESNHSISRELLIKRSRNSCKSIGHLSRGSKVLKAQTHIRTIPRVEMKSENSMLLERALPRQTMRRPESRSGLNNIFLRVHQQQCHR